MLQRICACGQVIHPCYAVGSVCEDCYAPIAEDLKLPGAKPRYTKYQTDNPRKYNRILRMKAAEKHKWD